MSNRWPSRFPSIFRFDPENESQKSKINRKKIGIFFSEISGLDGGDKRFDDQKVQTVTSVAFVQFFNDHITVWT